MDTVRNWLCGVCFKFVLVMTHVLHFCFIRKSLVWKMVTKKTDKRHWVTVGIVTVMKVTVVKVTVVIMTVVTVTVLTVSVFTVP